ncbi:recombinase RecT [Megasphaera sp. AM44-1BH]|uniref:recombinase RecT n=1 Tax=Megasphaera sp. AM44-1BH TaxID=2292358 RepID=UPI000E52AEA3|nr:recombinase RecT [Megasphaera sp. AM44-1BH]RHA11725.1 recombinase RecT [Megasphaera sp. AM44-1BH]
MATTKGGLATSKKVAPAAASPMKNMQDLIISMKGQIEAALPSVITGERFARMVLTAMSNTPQLASCTPKSFLGAMMQAAQLGLEPNTPLGEAYLIPFRNHGTLECQFQVGYKGMISLAHRSGLYVQAHEVHENDEFDVEYGLDPKLVHKPVFKDRGNVVAYYGMWKDKDGNFGFEVMSREDIEAHARKYSQSYGKGFSPWKTNFDEMAKKTVIKKALKYAPLTTEFIRGVTADGTIKTELSKDMVDVRDETNYTDIEAEPVPDNVDSKTGEVHDTHLNHETEDDRILEESLNM